MLHFYYVGTKYHVAFSLGVIVLKFLGSVRNYHFFENKYGTFTVFHKNKPIAHPATIEQVLAKMEQVATLKSNK